MDTEIKRMRKYKFVSAESSESIKEYLERMAREGWMLENITAGSKLEFVAVEPVEINYAVEMIPDGSIFDTHPTGKNEEYIEFCKKAGWEYICSSANIYIFYTKNPDAVPIETDEELKFQTIKKAMFRNTGIIMLILSGCSIMQLSMALTINLNIVESSVIAFSNLFLHGLVLLMACLFFWRYFRWIYKAKSAIRAGEKVFGKKAKSPAQALIFLAGFATVHGTICMILSQKYGDEIGKMVPVIWILVFGLVAICYWVQTFAERKRIGKTGHSLIQLIVLPFVFLLVLAGVTLIFIMHVMKQDSSADGVLTGDELKVFGYSQEFVAHEVKVDQDDEFVLHIQDICIEALNEDAKALRESGGQISGVEKDFCPITYTWNIMLYKTEVEAIYDRLLREVSNGIRTYGVRFDYNGAIKTEHMDMTTFEKEVEPGEYEYLIYDGSAIVRLRVSGEKLDEKQTAVIRRMMQE